MITLAEAKVGMADKVDQKVVDTFRRSRCRGYQARAIQFRKSRRK